MARSSSQYLVPDRSEREDTKLGFFKEQLDDAESYLKSQHSYKDIDKAIEIIEGRGSEKTLKNMSRIHQNIVKRDMREQVATMSNMRPLWGYKTDNPDYAHLAQVQNKMLQAWYLNTFADRTIRKALQYAAVCKGYVSPYWKNDFWFTGRGDIALKAYGPRNVFPYQMGNDHDLQSTYIVTIRDEVPFAKACTIYPLHIDKLSPDRSTPTWLRRGARRVQKFLSPVLDRFGPGRGRESDETTFPTVDIYRSYVLDTTYNDSDREIEMGAPGTKWNYKVPAYKSDIPAGIYDSAGRMLSRKATIEDCLLYPLRRLVIWTNQGIIYDDTNTDWHAKVPLVSFEFDDWPWNYLGASMIHEGESSQETRTALMRGMADSCAVRLEPPLQYDENTISEGLMQRLNTRQAGQRIKANMQMGEGIKPVLPAQYYDVPAFIPEFVKLIDEGLHYVLATRDIQAIAKARQIPAGDAMEKLMELSGPVPTDMSRNMEAALRDLGEMWKCLSLEYHDIRRRVQVLGKDGTTEEDFDYDPGTTIPSHLPDEFARIKTGQMRAEEQSRASIVERAKAHCNSTYFHITPGSVHQMTQISKKMIYMQLFRAGFPIDPWTVGEAMDLPNYGSPHNLSKILDGPIPSDIFGRWLAWVELQAKVAPQKGQQGRKPSGQQNPEMRSKSGGQRQTVAESPR